MKEENNIHKEIKILDSNNTIRFCSSCGEEILEGQKFCSKCGKNINKKGLTLKKILKNKKYICFFIGIILFIIGAISINTHMKNQQKLEQRNNYLSSIKDFHEQIIIAGANLEDISDTIQTYWKENIFDKKHGDDINEAILSAVLYKNSEIETAKIYDEELLELYRNLKTVPEGSEDLNDILVSIDALYDSYTDFYSFAIEPNGNYNQYSSDNNDKTNDFSSKYRSLSNIIKSRPELENIQSNSEKIKEKMNNVMRKYNLVSESMPKDFNSSDEKLKNMISDFSNKKNIEINEIKNESEKFKDNESINNAIEIVLSTSESYDNMIYYSKQYKKSNSQDDLDEFKSSVLDFRAHVAMYILHVDSLDGDGESLNDNLK